VSLFVVAVLAARVDSSRFYLRHIEYSPVIVAVEGGQEAQAGKVLVAHYSRDPASDALMFTEDQQTKNIVTVDGGLCITDDQGRPTPMFNFIYNTSMCML